MTHPTAAKGHMPFRDHHNQAQVRKDEEIGESLAKLGKRVSQVPLGEDEG